MTITKTALRIAIPAPLRHLFDYLPPSDCNLEGLQPGVRVRVPFQNRELIGILTGTTTESDLPWNKLKPAIEIIDSESIFTSDTWQLCNWAAEYYHYPIGEVLTSALPVLLRQGKKPELEKENYYVLTEKGRQIELEKLKKATNQVALLKVLKEHEQGLTLKQLREYGVKKGILDTLVEKGWASSHINPSLDNFLLYKGKCVEQHRRAQSSREAFATGSRELVTGTGCTLNEQMSTPHCETASFSEAKNCLDLDWHDKTRHALNPAQQQAVNAIQSTATSFHVFLLDGVTGSGKTEVYLQTITEFLKQEKQILVLVPEIGLTPQTIQRFRERFSISVVALHSGLSEKERLNAWISAKSGQAKIIIGTRSAIFTPFANLGLIIVDEEHDLSFKQQDTFRYHARDLAIMRAHFNKIPIVLGSATPSLETLHNAQQGRYQHLRLPQRAGGAQLPEFHIVDICKTPLEQGLSPLLLTEIETHLKQDAQVMLFLNRRGYSPVLMCHSCGWMMTCKRCDTRMTYHQFPERLHCHHCDSRRPVIKKCEGCGENELHTIGLGTERLEEILEKYFPQYSIARIDRDSTQRKGSLEELLNKIHNGEHRILIGTQMLAKGHHFPNVTLVAIVDADGGFFSTDFRAIERMGQLLLQVSGRAGRAEKPGKVFIQTHHPSHPLLHQLIRESYQDFATTLLKEREQASLPPYNFFALFRAEAYNVDFATNFLRKIKAIMEAPGTHIRILGPIPAPMPRRAGLHRAQLLIQAAQRPVLQNYLKSLVPEIEKIPSKHRVHWSLDVDPLEMF